MFVCRAVTLPKLLALLSHPTEQRADRAAAHPPPKITGAVSKAARVSLSAHPPMRKATAFLTLANARRWRAFSYLVSNVCVPSGNASQAASPALTAFGAESRPRSSPPTTLKLAFLYGNAFLQQISTAARFFIRKLRLPIKLEHIFSAPFLRSVLLRKNLLKKYAPKIRSAAVNICCKFLYSNAFVLYGNAYKLRARLSHPTEQRADLAASHPPP